MLYFFRFGPYFIEPVIAGIDPKTGEIHISSLDLIGCPMETDDFVVSGTCGDQMAGMCESLWKPDMVRVILCPLGNACVLYFLEFINIKNNFRSADVQVTLCDNSCLSERLIKVKF